MVIGLLLFNHFKLEYCGAHDEMDMKSINIEFFFQYWWNLIGYPIICGLYKCKIFPPMKISTNLTFYYYLLLICYLLSYCSKPHIIRYLINILHNFTIKEFYLKGIMLKQTLMLNTNPICYFYLADINECGTNNGGCSGTCTNSAGTYQCSCSTGYYWSEKGFSCIGQLLYKYAQIQLLVKTPLCFTYICLQLTDELNLHYIYCVKYKFFSL